MSIAEDLETQTKLYAELDIVIDSSWKHMLEVVKDVKLYSIKYIVPEAEPILKKYGLEGLVAVLDVTDHRACKFYYEGSWVKPKCHYLPSGKALPLFIILKEALKQKTSEPDIQEIESAYWAEKELEPKVAEITEDIDVIEGIVTTDHPEPEQKPLMQRFMGLMPSSEVKKRRMWSDGCGKHCTVEAGPNGWTIIFADAGTQYKDAAAGTEVNYAEASKRMLKLFPKAKELPCKACSPNKVTKKH